MSSKFSGIGLSKVFGSLKFRSQRSIMVFMILMEVFGNEFISWRGLFGGYLFAPSKSRYCVVVFSFSQAFIVSVGHVCVRIDFRMILFSSFAVHWNNLCFRVLLCL